MLSVNFFERFKLKTQNAHRNIISDELVLIRLTLSFG